MLWLVQDGSCHFWYDNWLASRALFLRAPVLLNLSFRDFIIHGHWNMHLLAQMFPHEVIPSVLRTPVLIKQQADEVVWMSTQSSHFSLATAFHEVRQVSNISLMLSRVWQAPTQAKVSFFMVRLLLGRLPLDDMLHTFGVHGPSKCVRCPCPSVESLECVFSTSHIAKMFRHTLEGCTALV